MGFIHDIIDVFFNDLQILSMSLLKKMPYLVNISLKMFNLIRLCFHWMCCDSEINEKKLNQKKIFKMVQ